MRKILFYWEWYLTE